VSKAQLVITAVVLEGRRTGQNIAGTLGVSRASVYRVLA
jgi:sugar-specific transcriptional regulator TrmB